MNIKNIMMQIILLVYGLNVSAQSENQKKDNSFINEVEDENEPNKVLHAEPLYIDLIRDLGARKGEKEWNLGLGLQDNQEFDSYEALIEYEWAPINRLGLEVELPFTFYSPQKGTEKDSVPSHQLNSLKLAAQWSFLVNERIATSMAIGYINEFELSSFKDFGKPLIKGNVYNPFLVIAKRWGNNYHTLVYTGPLIEHDFMNKKFHTSFEINTNLHYMITGTRNFIGIELNKTIDQSQFFMTIRPQMRIGIADNLLIGIIAGIPINRENERFSTFARLIWEPGHKKK